MLAIRGGGTVPSSEESAVSLARLVGRYYRVEPIRFNPQELLGSAAPRGIEAKRSSQRRSQREALARLDRSCELPPQLKRVLIGQVEGHGCQ